MNFNELFALVCSHLTRQGVSCPTYAGKPATSKALAKAEATMKIKLPVELRNFYQTVGDGFSLFWEADPNDSGKPFGSLVIPSLEELASTYLGLREGQLYSAEQAESYGFPHTKDPILAKLTAARMWHWLPVIDETNKQTKGSGAANKQRGQEPLFRLTTADNPFVSSYRGQRLLTPLFPRVTDLTDPEVAQQLLRHPIPQNLANDSQEVLIEGFIPPEAIRGIFNP